MRRLQPERGQDRGADHHYEGYYARISLPERGESFAFIGAMARTKDGAEVYALVLDGKAAKRSFTRFAPDDFTLDPSRPDARFGTTSFGPEQTKGSLGAIEWALTLSRRVRWPGLFASPIGPGLVVPALDSYWHVASLYGEWTGYLTIAGRRVEVRGAPGYVEKAWGHGFPRAWTWLSAQAFDLPGASLTAAHASARVGQLLGFPAGAICFHDGRRSYAFASHLGDSVKLAAEGGRWFASAEGPRHRLSVEAGCPSGALVELEGPLAVGVRPVALEALVGKAEVVLERRTRRGFVTVTRARTSLAGLEVGGEHRFVRGGA